MNAINSITTSMSSTITTSMHECHHHSVNTWNKSDSSHLQLFFTTSIHEVSLIHPICNCFHYVNTWNKSDSSYLQLFCGAHGCGQRLTRILVCWVRNGIVWVKLYTTSCTHTHALTYRHTHTHIHKHRHIHHSTPVYHVRLRGQAHWLNITLACHMLLNIALA